MPTRTASASIVSIGYEKRSPSDFADLLSKHRVRKLVDVRELPLSRRAGFSKRALQELLKSRGIEYLHVREAGNPFRKLRHDVEACLQAYREHLAAHPEIVDSVLAEVDGSVAFLCYERSHSECHRSVLIEAMLGRKPKSLRVIRVE